ncbi:VanZ family protein [bacterium AH-315-E09]|nr:VanZ family protein [bacterium AH-315-E09]
MVTDAIRRNVGKRIKLALLICVLYAMSDEAHQVFVSRDRFIVHSKP